MTVPKRPEAVRWHRALPTARRAPPGGRWRTPQSLGLLPIPPATEAARAHCWHLSEVAAAAERRLRAEHARSAEQESSS